MGVKGNFYIWFYNIPFEKNSRQVSKPCNKILSFANLAGCILWVPICVDEEIVTKNNQDKDRKGTYWAVAWTIFRNLKALEASGPVKSTKPDTLWRARFCQICTSPPARMTLNNWLYSMNHIQDSSGCYMQTNITGLYTHVMKQRSLQDKATGASVQPLLLSKQLGLAS